MAASSTSAINFFRSATTQELVEGTSCLEDGLLIQSGAHSGVGFLSAVTNDCFSLPAPDGDHAICCFQTRRHRHVRVLSGHDAGQDQLPPLPTTWKTRPFLTWPSRKPCCPVPPGPHFSFARLRTVIWELAPQGSCSTIRSDHAECSATSTISLTNRRPAPLFTAAHVLLEWP